MKWYNGLFLLLGTLGFFIFVIILFRTYYAAQSVPNGVDIRQDNIRQLEWSSSGFVPGEAIVLWQAPYPVVLESIECRTDTGVASVNVRSALFDISAMVRDAAVMPCTANGYRMDINGHIALSANNQLSVLVMDNDSAEWITITVRYRVYDAATISTMEQQSP